MKIKEILELTKTKTIAEIAKADIGVDESIVRKAMVRSGCYTHFGQSGWLFDSEENPENNLERSIYDFIAELAAVAEEEQQRYISSITEASRKDTTVRKRTSFDLDVDVVEKLKLHCVKEDKTLYEVVEKAINDYLEKEEVE